MAEAVDAKRPASGFLNGHECADDLPKHHYFARSQLAIAAMIGRVLRRG
jgi:hypothetical protein